MRGKTDEMVAQERQYFLDLFLKKCCELPYLAISEEMQIFLRPNGEVEKLLSNQKMPKTYALLQVYRMTVPV